MKSATSPMGAGRRGSANLSSDQDVMADILRGFSAGLVATLVISMVMIFRLAMGVMSWFRPIEIMNLNAQELLGTTSSPVLGWIIHFFVGVVIWGALYALVSPRLPGGTDTRRGLAFGTAAWLLIMITVFPLAGSGLFALGFGLAVPIWTLITHWIFGAVLGVTYGWLKSL